MFSIRICFCRQNGDQRKSIPIRWYRTVNTLATKFWYFGNDSSTPIPNNLDVKVSSTVQSEITELLPEDYVVVSLNVVSLFANIPGELC